MILLDALQHSTLGEAERLRKVNTIFRHIQTLGRATAQANIRGTRNILMELHAPQLQFFFFCYELLYLVLRLEHENQLRSLRRLHGIDTRVVHLNHYAVGGIARTLHCGSTIFIYIDLATIDRVYIHIAWVVGAVYGDSALATKYITKIVDKGGNKVGSTANNILSYGNIAGITVEKSHSLEYSGAADNYSIAVVKE